MTYSQFELLVEEHIRRGRHLLSLAPMVQGPAEHEVWRAQRIRWTDAASKALERARVAGSQVRSFDRTVAVPPSDGLLFELLPLECERVTEGIEFLRLLEDPQPHPQ